MRASWALVLLCCAGACEPERPRAGALLDADQPVVDVPPPDRVAIDRVTLDEPVPDASDDLGQTFDAPPLDGGARTYPSGPYSGRIGDVFPPFIALTCANERYEIAVTDFAPSSATLVLIAPGYCACTELERAAQSLWESYRARGLRVVTFLVQGATPGEMATGETCLGWGARFGLTHRVTYDSSSMLRAAFPGLMLPAVAITDANGRVTFFESGPGINPDVVRAQVATQLGPAM